MRIARLYVSLLLYSGIVGGVIYGLLSRRLVAGVLGGLVIGLTISAIGGTREVRAHRAAGGNFSPRVRSVVRVPADPALVRRRVVEALRSMPARIVTPDGADRIVARRGMTWSTWGTTITVEVRVADAGHTEVTLRCRPRPSWTPVDNAESQRIVNYLLGALGPDVTGEAAATTTSG
jgi:hypothetical protein